MYPQHEAAIEYITAKFEKEPYVLALLISGSVAHGLEGEGSDLDINIVVTPEFRAEREREDKTTYYENGDHVYPGLYFDGKFVTLEYLRLVAQRGNEPTRFALSDARVAFDRTGQVSAVLADLARYPEGEVQARTLRFLAQLDGWKWFCGEAIKRQNLYLLDTAVTKLILFAGRLVLLHNRVFFPYHKWFLHVLADVSQKPEGLMQAIDNLLHDKTAENVQALYDMVKEYRDWTNGASYSWTSTFVHDVETVWMRGDEMVDNL